MPDGDPRERLPLRFVQGFSQNVPHNRALGIEIVEILPGEAVFRLPYDAKLVGNPDTGVLHGGAITALLDGASGAAVFATLAELVPIATLDLRIDYLRPAEAGRAVMARGDCYKMTRNVAFTRAVAYHDDPSRSDRALGRHVHGLDQGREPPEPVSLTLHRAARPRRSARGDYQAFVDADPVRALPRPLGRRWSATS